MNVTLLITISTEPDEDLAALSARIQDKLSNEYAVVNVKPWARPKTAPSAAAKAVATAFKTLPR